MRSSDTRSQFRRLRRLRHLRRQEEVATRTRRRRLSLLGAMALAVAVPATMLTIPLLDRSGAMAGAISTLVTDPGALFAARSPGARGSAALTQTKLRMVKGHAARPLVPGERVLGQERSRPPVPGALPPGEPAVPFVPVELASTLPDTPFVFTPDNPITPGGTPPIGNPPVGGPPVGGPPVGGPPGDTPPGDTPPGDTPPGDTPPGDTPPVVNPVPEPGTWAMSILGFFLIGSVIRRRRRIPAREVARPAPG